MATLYAEYVPWKARKSVAADLRLLYRASTAAEAEQHLAQLEGKWKAYPSVSQVWRRNWARDSVAGTDAGPG